MNKLYYLMFLGIGMMASLFMVMLFSIQPFAVEAGSYNSIYDLVSTPSIMAGLLSVITGITLALSDASKRAELYGDQFKATLRGIAAGITGSMMASLFYSSTYWSIPLVGFVVHTIIMVSSGLIALRILSKIFAYHDAEFGPTDKRI